MGHHICSFIFVVPTFESLPKIVVMLTCGSDTFQYHCCCGTVEEQWPLNPKDVGSTTFKFFALLCFFHFIIPFFGFNSNVSSVDQLGIWPSFVEPKREETTKTSFLSLKNMIKIF